MTVSQPSRSAIAKKATKAMNTFLGEKSHAYHSDQEMRKAFRDIFDELFPTMHEKGFPVFKIGLLTGNTDETRNTVKYEPEFYIPYENPATKAFEPIVCRASVTRYDFAEGQTHPEIVAYGNCLADRTTTKEMLDKLAANGVTHTFENGKWHQHWQ